MTIKGRMEDKERKPSSPRRRFSLDKEQDEDVSSVDAIKLRRLQVLDEKEFKSFERQDLVERPERRDISTLTNKKDQIKLAAIYNNRVEVLNILQSEKDMESIQKLLAEHDERGQPCIFYALESRSRDVLEFLMSQVRNTDCIVAANGESVLHVATKMGDVDILRSLMTLDLAANLVDHVENENGRAPLHLAAKFNHIDIAKELLGHGARFDRQDITGRTPIFMAASKGHSAMLEIFLNHGHDTIDNLILDHSHTLYGKAYQNLLQVAVDSGDEETVDTCLNQDPEVIRQCLSQEIKNPNSWLIHVACKNGMENCFVKFLDAMGTLEKLHLNRKDEQGFTPIHRAALHNHVKIVRMIGSISRSFVNQTTPNSQSTLMLAVQAGHVKVVEELLDLNADFKISDASGRTVLHYAIEYPKILEMLLEKDDLVRLLINKREKDGYATVHHAALKGLCKCFKLLLERGADINVFTTTGRSPLHCAVSSQSTDIVILVLSNEPALINKADATGKTPLHTAASYGNSDIVKVLLDRGALIVRDRNIYTPLHNAAHKGHLKVVEMLLAFSMEIINWKNKYGRSALTEAATTGKSDVVEFLLEKGACVKQDHEFLNCLDWCLINNDQETAMVLMKNCRWSSILQKTKHGTDGTMAKLVYKMPEVAYQVLSNSMTSQGHPDSKEHVKRYDFLCLQSNFVPDKKSKDKMKPMTAIKTMIRAECYSCLTHPVCCKFLRAKWMEYGWKIHLAAILTYIIFLVCLNVYAFGIPAYKGNEDEAASVNVKVAMVICLLFTSINTLKETYQLAFYRKRYFLDIVNYLECILYLFVFIFAVPIDGRITVKTTLQWKAGSIALFLAWVNLVLFLRRFASYGIIVLMMKKIGITLIKVLSLLIFFFVAFAAAFSPIMNDKQGFDSFGLSMITSAVMTMGEFDFKETFLKEQNPDYATFFWIRFAMLVVFLVIMPIILMNLLLALAIDDTSKIRRHAELRKHIQMAEMIIELERRRFLLPNWILRRKDELPPVEERPNKRPNIFQTYFICLFYGKDYSGDNETNNTTDMKDEHEQMSSLVDMVKDMHDEIKALREELNEVRGGTAVQKKRPHRKELRSASTQFRGSSVSFNENVGENRRKLWLQSRGKFSRTVSQAAGPMGDSIAEDVFETGQDIQDEKERETKECDPELIELKELHKKNPLEEYETPESQSNDEDGEGIRSRLGKMFHRVPGGSDEADAEQFV